MSSRYHIDLATAIAPTVPADTPRGWRYAPELAALDDGRTSGVYVIIERGQVLYVGESHTGRLFDTITRHFRKWRVDASRDAQGRRRGGTTYNRDRVKVAWVECPAGDAQELQYKAIQRLNPRDNVNDGCSDGSCDLPV